jgi:putative mycofactocin binding protein MftB
MTHFDAHLAWQRSPSVVLRPEPFGALAYDFTSRRLSFLKTPALVRVVEQLIASASAWSALETAGITEAERAQYLTALASLARSGLIVRRSRTSEAA